MGSSHRFFKIIVDHCIKNNKLMLPRRFVRKHGTGLSSPAILRVPDGVLWKVELMKCGDDVWLCNGWKEFADCYNLKYGHLVVFRLEGNSEFSILVFDKCATEIDYPICHEDQHFNFQEPKKGPYTTRTRREKSPLPYTQPQKKLRTGDAVTTAKSEILGSVRKVNLACFGQDFKAKSSGNGVISAGEKKMRGDETETETAAGTSKSETLSSKRKVNLGSSSQEKTKCQQDIANAMKRARTFKSKNPFFLLRMTPAYISHVRLTVPAKFSKYFNKNEGNIVLYNLSRKSWWVKYVKVGKQQSIKLSKGWTAFVRDNCFESGDVCVFELVDEATFRVSIFRVTEDGCCSGKDEQLRNEKKNFNSQPDECPPCLRIVPAIESACKFVSQHPSLQVVMRPAYLKEYVHLPLSFVKNHMQLQQKNTTLQFEGRTWSASFSLSTNRFYGGWRTFVKDNSLKDGDVCVFEVIDGSKSLIKVSIFRNEN